MSGIVDFISYKNKYPTSSLEKIGDYLLTSISRLCIRNSFIFLKNKKTDKRCTYTVINQSNTNKSKSCLKVVSDIIVSTVTFPITLIGTIFKGLSLITSKEARDIYLHWTIPLQVYLYNSPKIQDDCLLNSKELSDWNKNLLMLLQFVIKKGCAPQFLDEFIRNPYEYLVDTYSSIVWGNHVHFLALSECSCISGNFNRFKNKRRENLENQLIEDVKKSFPPSNKFKLNYVGFGAGELLQDFINIGKLIREGYNNLNIILIDPNLEEKTMDQKNLDEDVFIPNPVLETFKIFLLTVAKQKGIKIEIQRFKNITEYRQKFPNKKAHIISAIDFDDYHKAFNDVVLCHQILDKNGKFYLSYDKLDFCFGFKKCLNIKQHANLESLNVLKEIKKDIGLLSQKLAQKKQKIVRYAQLKWNLDECVDLLSKLAKSGCNKIEFTLIKPSKIFTKKNLEYYLKLFLPESVKIEVKLFDSIKSFKHSIELLKTKFDIITFTEILDMNKLQKKILNGFKQHLTINGNIYYAIEFYKRDKSKKITPISFSGIWRWNMNLGIKFINTCKREHKLLIKKMMEEKIVV